MRKFGVFSDIHSNILALNAVLDELERRGVDGYICAGDMFSIGPHPVECVRRIMALENLTISRGNHEDYHSRAAHLYPNFTVGGHDASPDEYAHHSLRYDTVRADAETHEFACSLPLTATLECCGHNVTVVHYAPASRKYPAYAGRAYAMFPPKGENTAERLLDMFREGGIDGDIIISGHEHAPSLHVVDQRLLINPGSLGCSRSGDGAPRHGARFGILTLSSNGAAFEPLEVDYDVDTVRDEVVQLPDGVRLAGMFF